MEVHDPAAFVEHLDHVHARTRRVVALIKPADVEWAPKDGWLTFGGLVRHLAGIERWMYAETVRGRPDRAVAALDGGRALNLSEQLEVRAVAVRLRADGRTGLADRYERAGRRLSELAASRRVAAHDNPAVEG